MSRTKVLMKRPRRTLGALAAVLVATAVAVGSGANFTATSANPGNAFATGTLSMVNSLDGVAVFSAANMTAGGPAQLGTVDIQNTGSLSGTFSLSRTNLTDSDATNPLSGKLNLVVKDCGLFVGATAPTCGDADDVTRYTGTLSAMNSSIALGTYAASDKHRYQFSVSLDSSATDAYQGDSSTARFQWDAVQ